MLQVTANEYVFPLNCAVFQRQDIFLTRARHQGTWGSEDIASLILQLCLDGGELWPGHFISK